MSVVAPPRGPSASDPLDQAEVEALVEALIEEARQRACRRRRIRGAVAALAALVAIAVFATFERVSGNAADSPASASAPAVPSAGPAGAIALTGLGGSALAPRSTPRVVVWTRRDVRETGIVGRAFGWSPDGSRLLVARGTALWVVRADGAGSVRLPRRGDGFNAVWSPDGTRIAFEGAPRTTAASSWTYRRIYVVGADGTGLRRLPGLAVEGGLFSGNLAWSPDGTQILFAGRLPADRRHWLYLVSADGSTSPRPLRIRSRLSDPAQPAWSPDGSRLAFVASGSGSGSSGGLFVMNADGTGVRLLAGGHGPVWSPDSAMLAFRGAGNQTVRADGSHLTTLPPGSWSGLSWSPDSRFIAYTGGEGHAPNGDVFVVRPNGTGLVRILHRPGSAYGLPLWRHGTTSTEAG